MDATDYGQYCPLSRGAEVFAERWTPLIVFELMSGSRRFNDLRRGLPRISPTLLSRRLAQLEVSGLLVRRVRGRSVEYELTEDGAALGPVIESLALWGKEHARTEVSMDALDAQRLMWDIRRRIRRPDPTRPRTVVAFELTPPLEKTTLHFWLIFDDAAIDLCMLDPGFEPDMVVRGELRALAGVWIGDTTLASALRQQSLILEGDSRLCRAFAQSLGTSAFVEIKAQAKARDRILRESSRPARRSRPTSAA